jgi:hypothetical protein
MNVFLIDADNLNSGAWVDEAFSVVLETEGPLPVRRAYGSADNLKALADSLRAWAVRPFANLALTKNTTDMALAVDAMELALQTPAPKLVVIGSGDADFLPLVVRLRERGIRMVCVSERSKMAREAIPAYDRVILVGQEPPGQQASTQAVTQANNQGTNQAGATAPARKTARKTAAKQARPHPLPADLVLAALAPAKKAATKKIARQKSASEPKTAELFATDSVTLDATEPVVSEGSSSQMPTLDVAAILQAVPSLLTGQAQPLAMVAKALLDAKLRGKNTTATKLLKKFPQCFVLLPPEKPRTVTYTPLLGGS